MGDMYNRYTCPLQPCRHLTLKLLIQGHPRSAEVTHIADFKSAYISLIIGPRGLQCGTVKDLANSMASEVTTSQKPFLTLVLAPAVWLERVPVPALFRPPMRL